MYDQPPLLSPQRDFALDLLNFLAEQIELAKANPADQHCQRRDTCTEKQARRRSEIDVRNCLQNRFDRSWREEWDLLAAKEPHEDFQRAADALYNEIDSLRKAVVAHFI